QLAIQSRQKRAQFFRKPARVEMSQVGQQLLNLAADGWNLVILGTQLVKYGSRRVRHDFQFDVKHTGHQALGIQAASEPLINESVQLGFAANLQALIRFGLGELFVDGDDNGHREVAIGLVVTNQDLDDRTNRDSAKFHRRARVQSFQ